MTLTRYLDLKIEFQWDGSTWTDETAYFISAKGAYEFIAPGEAYQSARQLIQQMTVILANPDNRFSAYFPTSVLNTYADSGGAYHKKCRLQVFERVEQTAGQEDWVDTWRNIFVGFVKVPNDGLLSNRVSFTVWDAGEILRKKYSSVVYENYQEHELVQAYLQLAGLVDGEDFVSPTYAMANGVERTLDYSSTTVPYSWLDDEEIWGELGDIAQASGSIIYVDPDGMVVFRKGWRWATVDNYEGLGPDDSIDIAVVYDDKAFYDKVTVEYADRSPGKAGTELWSQPKAKIINPHDSDDMTARFSQPALEIDTAVADEDYFLTTIYNTEVPVDVTIGVVNFGQQSKITVTNNSDEIAVLASYTIKGMPLHGSPAEQYDLEIPVPYHDRDLDIRGNPYIMRKFQAETVAKFLRWWYGSPKPTVVLKGLRGRASRRLGMGVYAEISGVHTQGIIIKIAWKLGLTRDHAIRFTQDVTVLSNGSFTGTTDGQPTSPYFILDQDQIGGAKKVWH